MPETVTADIPPEDLDASSDEDFNPTAQPEVDTEESSESEDEAAAVPSRNKGAKKRTRPEVEAELDSGDEATIRERQKRRKKTKGKRDAGEDYVSSDDEAGQGGLVKTRSQRRAEGKEQRPLASLEGARGDIDAIWASMNAPRREDVAPGSILMDAAEKADAIAEKENAGSAGVPKSEEECITIERTYEFAGEIKTEKRRVPKHSEEAKVYLESQAAKKPSKDREGPKGVTDGQDPGKPVLRRPLKRTSRFEPNPIGEVRALPDKLQLRWPRTTDEDGNALEGVAQPAVKAKPEAPVKQVRIKPADKVNTVDKSRMDWAGFVDKEGIAEELDKYGKAKENFVAKNQLLARLDERREEQGRQARIRGQG